MVHVSIRFWNVYRIFCHFSTSTILAVRISKNSLDERMNDKKTVDLHSRTTNCTLHFDILLILYCISLFLLHVMARNVLFMHVACFCDK